MLLWASSAGEMFGHGGRTEGGSMNGIFCLAGLIVVAIIVVYDAFGHW
jgi:predicted membrane protein